MFLKLTSFSRAPHLWGARSATRRPWAGRTVQAGSEDPGPHESPGRREPAGPPPWASRRLSRAALRGGHVIRADPGGVPGVPTRTRRVAAARTVARLALPGDLPGAPTNRLRGGRSPPPRSRDFDVSLDGHSKPTCGALGVAPSPRLMSTLWVPDSRRIRTNLAGRLLFRRPSLARLCPSAPLTGAPCPYAPNAATRRGAPLGNSGGSYPRKPTSGPGHGRC